MYNIATPRHTTESAFLSRSKIPSETAAAEPLVMNVRPGNESPNLLPVSPAIISMIKEIPLNLVNFKLVFLSISRPNIHVTGVSIIQCYKVPEMCSFLYGRNRSLPR